MMIERKQLDKMSTCKVLILALLKMYIYMCTALLLICLFIGASYIIIPLIY